MKMTNIWAQKSSDNTG